MLGLLCFKSLAMLVILIHHCPTMLHLHLLDGLVSDCYLIP